MTYSKGRPECLHVRFVDAANASQRRAQDRIIIFVNTLFNEIWGLVFVLLEGGEIETCFVDAL